MAYNHEYPYVDPNRYNSDWILNKIKDLMQEMSDFIALNKITFSGDWSIAKQYPAWTVVNDGMDGYISVKPVPAGIAIDNTEYWQPIANYSAIIADLQNRVAALEGSDFAYTPEMFGAVGDGVNDDTLAIQKAIDQAIADHRPCVLTRNYLTNTLNVSGAVEICGGGQLITPGFRYDTTLSALDDSGRYFESAHADFYHPHTFISVHDSTDSQALVVTKVEGNRVYVAPTFYENATDEVHAFSSGATVNIHFLAFYVGHDETVAVSNVQIEGVNIHDLSITGSLSGYESANYIIYDVRYNGHIFAHSMKGGSFRNLVLDTANDSSICLLGECIGVIVSQNNIRNIRNADSAVEIATETAIGITLHWSQRFPDADITPRDCVISENVVTNCYSGIFLSAASRNLVSKNHISTTIFRGIALYVGDNAYFCDSNIVDGNLLINTNTSNSVAAVYVAGATRNIISNNIILIANNGITVGDGTDVTIKGNIFDQIARFGVTYYNGTQIQILENTFKTVDVVSIYVEKLTTGDGQITISGNVHKGSRTTNGAIRVKKGNEVLISDERCINIPYLLTIDTANVSLGDVYITDCFGFTGGPASVAEQTNLHIHHCVNSAFTVVNNI